MTEIKLHYRPIPLIGWKRGVTFRFPVSWVELSDKQMVTVSLIMEGTVSDNKVVRSMLGVSRKVARRLTSYQKYNLMSLLSFINQFDAHHSFIIPEIKGFTAPEPRLKDETFAAFLFAEHYFDRYMKSSSLEDLCLFVACWYRDGEFSDKDLESRSRILMKADRNTLDAISLNYHLIREWLAESYPAVFAYSAPEYKPKTEATWLDVLDAIVGEDIIHHDDYASLPVNNVLRFLNTRIKESRSCGKR